MPITVAHSIGSVVLAASAQPALAWQGLVSYHTIAA